jgi:hypothetical protein
MSYVAPQILRAEAMLQRFTRRGPQDTGHIPGSSNLLGDFPSRSFDEHPANLEGDASFSRDFSLRHPLPLQLGQWQYVHPTSALTSLICSLLRGRTLMCGSTTIGTGGTGPPLPSLLANILSCQTPNPRPTTWNAPCCSWPLLSPYGKVDSTMVTVFAERKSRGRFAKVGYVRPATRATDCIILDGVQKRRPSGAPTASNPKLHGPVDCHPHGVVPSTTDAPHSTTGRPGFLFLTQSGGIYPKPREAPHHPATEARHPTLAGRHHSPQRRPFGCTPHGRRGHRMPGEPKERPQKRNSAPHIIQRRVGPATHIYATSKPKSGNSQRASHNVWQPFHFVFTS